MESFFLRFRNALVLIAILLAQTVLLAVQVQRADTAPGPEGHKIRLIRLWANAVMSPFERLAHGTGRSVRGAWSNYVDLRHVREQNAALHDEVARLRLEQAALAQDAAQGHRLQALLAFQQHYIAATVAAQVIGTGGLDQTRLLILDKGRSDGLKPEMAVITPDGAVGRLRDVFEHTSQLVLLNDQTSGAGVLLAKSRIRAILHGSPTGRLQITNLTPDERIKPGETVLTSGGDLIYPRGITVGTVETVALDPDHQPYALITVRPAANLSQLEEVLVVTATQSALPAATRQDLAIAESTAHAQTEAAAAEAAAEAKNADDAQSRLPGFASPEAKGGASSAASAPASAAAADKSPGGVVPRPLPTRHTDRYSPGTAPPASSLTPGSPNRPQL